MTATWEERANITRAYRQWATSTRVLWAIGLASCTGAVDAPTQFKLDALTTGDRGATETQAVSDAAVAFDLGEVRATRDYFFTLRNTSDEPLTDVTLTTSDAAFIVEPKQIAVLSPEHGELTTTVRLTVVHGRAPSGIGQAANLPMGTNTATLTIQGTHAGTSVNYAAELKLEAKVAAIALSDANGTPVESRYGTLSMFAPHYTGRYQSYCISDDLFVTNTGNVDLSVRQDFSPTLFVLAPGEKQTISAPWRSATTLWVYSTDAVGDPVAFPSDNTGSTALYFSTLSSECPAAVDPDSGAGGSGGAGGAGGSGGVSE